MGKIFGPRAIYVHAEHGPYEESDRDPAGVYEHLHQTLNDRTFDYLDSHCTL